MTEDESENNELRCTAHEIILALHKLKALGQIQLLHMAASLALKDLDPAAYRETVINAYNAITRKA